MNNPFQQLEDLDIPYDLLRVNPEKRLGYLGDFNMSFRDSNWPDMKCLMCGQDSTALICEHCCNGYSPQKERDAKEAAEEICCANTHPHVPGGIHCTKD